MTKSVDSPIAAQAVCKVSRLCRWLANLYKVTPDAMRRAVESQLESRLEKAKSEKVIGCEVAVRNEYAIFGAAAPAVLLESIRTLRGRKDLSPLRFGQWGLAAGEGDSTLARAADLARMTDPPCQVALAEVELLKQLDRPLVSTDILGRPAPAGASWLELDPKGTALEAPPPTNSVGNGYFRAYADAWGVQSWADEIEPILPPGRRTPNSLTTLCEGLIGVVAPIGEHTSVRAGTRGARRPKAGPGADGVHLVADSADKLLKTVIWVQSELARSGAAFFPWTLGVGAPLYVDDQPSDSEFLHLYHLLKYTTNGDVLATPDFVSRLEREELIDLARVRNTPDGPVAEMHWWEFPYRTIEV